MPISRYNPESKRWEIVAGGDASEITVVHPHYQGKTVFQALTEIYDVLTKHDKNLRYLYHNGSGKSRSFPYALPMMLSALSGNQHVITDEDSRQRLDITTKAEGDEVSADEFNALVEVINNNAELFMKIGAIQVPTENGGAQTKYLKTAEDIVTFLKEYGIGLPGTNMRPQLLFDKTTLVFPQRGEVKIPLTIADAEGGKFMASFTMTDYNGSSSVHKFYDDDGYTDGSKKAALHTGLNVIAIPTHIINSNSPGNYRLSDFKVFDAYYKSSEAKSLNLVVGTISISEFTPPNTVPLNEISSIQVRYVSVLRAITLKTTTVYRPMDGGASVSTSDTKDIVLDEDYSPTAINTYNLQVYPTTNAEYEISIQIVDTETGGAIISTPVLKRSFVSIDENTIYVLPTLTSDTYNRYGVVSMSIRILHLAKIAPLYDIHITSDGNVETTFRGVKEYEVKNLSVQADTEMDYLSLTFTAIYKGTEMELVPVSKTIRITVTSPEFGSVYTGTGTVMWLDGRGRSNKEEEGIRNLWPNKIKKSAQYYAALTNLRTELNGWEEQADGLEYTGNCLTLSAGAYGIVSGLKPFERISLSTGLTIEVCMHSASATSVDTTLFSCGEVTNLSGIVSKNGIFITPQEMQVFLGSLKMVQPNSNDKITYQKNGNVNINEEEYLHIAFVYKKDGALHQGKDLCLIYINGMIANAIALPAYTSMNHSGEIILNGYRDHDGKIKGQGTAKFRFVRVYERALTPETILQNYIASMYNSVERSNVIEVNRDWESGDVPIVSKMYMEGDSSSMTGDIATRMLWSMETGREEDLYQDSLMTPEFIPNPIGEDGVTKFEQVAANTKWQGSSSKDYMIKNYTIDILPLLDLLAAMKFRMTQEFPLLDTYQMKANYIDSSGANNIACAKIANQIWSRNWSDEALKTIQKYRDPALTDPIYLNPMFRIMNDQGQTISSRFPLWTKFHALNGFPYILYRDFKNKNQMGQLVYNRFGGIYMCNLQHNGDLYGFESFKNSSDGNPSSGPWARHLYYKHDNNGASTFAAELTAHIGMFDPRAIRNYTRNGKSFTSIKYREFGGVKRSLEECLGFELLMCYAQDAPDVMGLGKRNGKDHTQWTYAALAESGGFGESLQPFTNLEAWKYSWQWHEGYMYNIGTGQEPIRQVNSQDEYSFNANSVKNISKYLVQEGSNKYLQWDKYAALAYHQNLDFINATLWVATCLDSEFADPQVFNRFFRLDACVDYLIMCMLFQMSDSLGRNLIMVGYDKQEPVRVNGVLKGYKSSDKTVFAPHVYDADTAFSTDVYGTISNPYMPWPHAINRYQGVEARKQVLYRISCNLSMLEPDTTSVVLSAYQRTETDLTEVLIKDPVFRYLYYDTDTVIGQETDALDIPQTATSVKVLLYLMVGNQRKMMNYVHLPVRRQGRVNLVLTDELYGRSQCDVPNITWIVNNDNQVMRDQTPTIRVQSFDSGSLDAITSYAVEVDGTYKVITEAGVRIDPYYPFLVKKSGQDLLFSCKRLDAFNLMCTGDTLRIRATTASGVVINAAIEMGINNSFEFSYNCVSNMLWRRLCKHYSPAISARYSELRKGYVDANNVAHLPILTTENVIDKYCSQIVNRVGERYYNADAFLKYFGSEYDTADEIATKRAFVSNARGNKFLFVKDFMNKRMLYIDSVLGYVDETTASKGSISIRHGFQGVMKLRLASVQPAFITLQWAQGEFTPIYLPGNNEVVEAQYDYSGTVSSGQTWMKLLNCPSLSLLDGLTDKKIEKIEFNGAVALRKIDLSMNSFIQENPMTFIGCENLEELYLSKITGNGVAINIDISRFPQLKKIDISDSVMAVPMFSANKLLEYVNISKNSFTTELDLSGVTTLTTLKLTPANLTHLNISDTHIDFAAIEMEEVRRWTLLNRLVVSNNPAVTAIKRTGDLMDMLPQLVTLEAMGCENLHELDVSGSVKLTKLEVDNRYITGLNIGGGCSLYIDLTVGGWDHLVRLNTNGNAVIRYFGGAEAQTTNIFPALTTVDLRNCPLLERVNVSFMNTITSLMYSHNDITEFNLSDVNIDMPAYNPGASTGYFRKLKRLVILNNNAVKRLYGNQYNETTVFASLEFIDVRNCASLTNISSLFYKNTLITAYSDSLFDGCPINIMNNLFSYSLLRKVPLRIANLMQDQETLNSIFERCTLLDDVSNIPTHYPRLRQCAATFFGCLSIVSLPDGFMEDCPLLEDANNMLNACNGLLLLPAGFMSNTPLLKNAMRLLSSCYKLVSIPDGFLSVAPLLVNVNDLLADCRLLSSLPDSFLNSAPLLTTAAAVLSSCLSLEHIPAGFMSDVPNLIHANNFFARSAIKIVNGNFLKKSKKVETINSMFDNCSNNVSIETDVFNEMPELKSAIKMFSTNWEGSAKQLTLPDGFLSICPKLTNVEYFLASQSHFQKIPTDLLANSPLMENMAFAFQNGGKTKALTGSTPEYWNMYPNAVGTNCFFGQTNLDNYNSVPSQWGGPDLSRTIVVRAFGTNVALQGAKVVIGNQEYYTNEKGEVIYFETSSITVVVSVAGYGTQTVTFESIIASVINTVSLYPMVTVSVLVRSMEQSVIAGAVISCNGMRVTSDANGMANLILSNGAYSYTCTFERFSANGNFIVGTSNMDTTIEIDTSTAAKSGAVTVDIRAMNERLRKLEQQLNNN